MPGRACACGSSLPIGRGPPTHFRVPRKARIPWWWNGLERLMGQAQRGAPDHSEGRSMPRRFKTTIAALLMAVLTLILPAPAHAGAAPARQDPSIGTAIRALQAELGRTAAPDRASLDGWLVKALQADGDTCAAAAALHGFAG